jgi:hypothetical protein
MVGFSFLWGIILFINGVCKSFNLLGLHVCSIETLDADFYSFKNWNIEWNDCVIIAGAHVYLLTFETYVLFSVIYPLGFPLPVLVIFW